MNRFSALVAASLALVMSATAQATVLTFDTTYLNTGSHAGEYSFFKGAPQSQYWAYGDNVTGPTLFPVPNDPEPSPFYRYNYEMGNLPSNDWTPDVTVDYAVGANANDIRGYNGDNWPRVAYLQGTPTTAERKFYFTFTPAGLKVAINSFRFYSFAYGTYGMDHDVTWSIYSNSSVTKDGNGVVTAFTGTLQDSGSTGTFGATSGLISTQQEAYGGPVTLVIHHTSGNHGFLGIDDINFDQVPEPASMTLLSLGMLFAGRRARRA